MYLLTDSFIMSVSFLLFPELVCHVFTREIKSSFEVILRPFANKKMLDNGTENSRGSPPFIKSSYLISEGIKYFESYSQKLTSGIFLAVQLCTMSEIIFF